MNIASPAGTLYGMPRSAAISHAKLRDAFVADLAVAWASHRRRHPDHTPYAFVLYGVEGAPPRLSPHVLTEQWLTQVAQCYVREGYYETPDEARDELRYSVADSPGFDDLPYELPHVEPLLKPHDDSLEESKGYEMLAKAAIDALKKLDEEGLFGKRTSRAKLLLIIITEDTDKDWSEPSARTLNPQTVFKRYQEFTRIRGVFRSCQTLAPGRDGRTLYFAGTRDVAGNDDDDDNETIAEIVACGVRRGRSLQRRWTFEFPAFGDSVGGMAVLPDATLLVARRQYVGQEKRILVMRFGQTKNVPLAQNAIPGELSHFAVSSDGARIALTTRENRLILLDADLQPFQQRDFTNRLYGVHFLRSGHLLLATAKVVIRLDPQLQATSTVLKSPAFRFSTDASGQLLAVSSWFLLHPESEDFGITLLSLPSLKVKRTITVPGYRAVNAVLSPDARFLAFEIHATKTKHQFVVVFELRTGKDVVRRKSDFIKDLAFLSDNRTLAIGQSGFTQTEAVTLWPLPKARPAVRVGKGAASRTQ